MEPRQVKAEVKAAPTPAPRPTASLYTRSVQAPKPRLQALHLPRPRRLQRALPIALAALLILAAGAYGLSAVLGSSTNPAAPAAIGPTGPMRWLGMQIESVTPGGVVIATVATGSPGQLAGLEPGDVIVEINHRPVTSTGDVSGAIGGLRAGDQVEIHVSRGSTPYTTQATLAAPPSNYP